MFIAKSCARAELPSCTADMAPFTVVLADWAGLSEEGEPEVAALEGVLMGVCGDGSPMGVLGRCVAGLVIGGGDGVRERRLLTRVADSRICRIKTCDKAYFSLG